MFEMRERDNNQMERERQETKIKGTNKVANESSEEDTSNLVAMEDATIIKPNTGHYSDDFYHEIDV